MPAWHYPVRTDHTGRPVVIEVHDGDTVRLLCDAGADAGLFPKLRIAGVDCPELRAPGGREAREFTAQHLAAARSITVTIHYRSFDRWVATVLVDGLDFARVLIDAGHATPWPPT